MIQGVQRNVTRLTRYVLIIVGIAIIAISSLLTTEQDADGLAGTPDAVNDSVVMYEDSGPITINWITNDDMDDNATLNSFDAASTNSGTVTNNGDGTFDFTPATDYSGGDGFTYTICDDDVPTAECDTASVSITIVATSTCLTGFYQTLSGEINVLDTSVTPAQYVAAAADIGELNATGYNPNDGLIYGFSSNLDEVVSFDPNTGTFTNVFTHTEDNPFAGDMDGSNNLYYNTSSSTTLYVYNTVLDTRSTITLPSSHGVADFAYVPSNDLFYGIQSGGDNMAVIDVSPAGVTTTALSGPITSETGGFGAVWVTGNTDLYAFNNDSGNIFSINISTGVSTLQTISSPNGSNDGMSCAAATSPFNISSILDYGDAPDTYGTLLASSGASAVVNTSYRIGNFNEIDADGQPGTNADADDGDDIGDDEDGVRIGVNSLENGVVYEGESNTISVDVPLDNGYVSLWIDQNNDGDFLDAGEQFATDVQPTSGVASLTFTPSNTTSSIVNTYARIRLAARTGGGPTGLFSFGEVEDYRLQLNPSRPTITNNALSTVTAANASSYNITGTCTDNGDAVDVAVNDGSTTVNATSTTCSSGTFNVTVNISGLNDGMITVTSTINDSINSPVTDTDTVSKDANGPTIDQATQAAISNTNQTSYPVSGTCSDNGDSITVTLADSDSPANTESTSTTCSSGTYSVSLDASSLMDGAVNVNSTIDDGTNPTVSDDENVTKDTVLPTITQSALATITNTNITAYSVSGVCSAVGDSVTIFAVDSSTPFNSAMATTTCVTGGTYTKTLDLSSMDAGTISIESKIDDGVNPIVKDDGTTTLANNLDDDDTSSSEEKAGPNDGDGNNDGIADHIQDNVTTKINPVIAKYTTTVASGNCSEFNVVNFFKESDLAVTDGEYDYALGLHGFEVDCLSSGGAVNITHYWDQEYDTSSWAYRKFIAATNSFIDFTDQVTYGTAVIDGKKVTTVSFSVIDGGPYDSDGVANGTVVDPVGPAVLAATLSDTGQETTSTMFAGAIIVISTLTLSAFSYRSYATKD